VNLPWRQRKPQQAKPSTRFVGMSQKPTISGDVAKILPSGKPKQPEKKVARKAGLLTPMQPYIAIITDDIKRLLRIDVESRRKKEEYRDFMEQHFGKK